MNDTESKIFATKAINKPYHELEIIHIDALAERCGAFDSGSELNNGYGCKATAQDIDSENPGCCYTFACPLAVEADEEDEQWESNFSEGDWVIQHSVFANHGDVNE